MMVESIGYLAIVIGLIAMSCKDIKWLRTIHCFSALAYVVYGMWINAFPIVIGGLVFMTIHIYYLVQHYFRKKKEHKNH